MSLTWSCVRLHFKQNIFTKRTIQRCCWKSSAHYQRKDVCQIPKKNTICQLSTGCFHRFLAVKGKKKLDVIPTYILLMEEILHHLGCIKPCKKWDNLLINWCRISSINSISFKTLVSKKHPFMPHGSLWNHLLIFLGRTTWNKLVVRWASEQFNYVFFLKFEVASFCPFRIIYQSGMIYRLRIN